MYTFWRYRFCRVGVNFDNGPISIVESERQGISGREGHGLRRRLGSKCWALIWLNEPRRLANARRNHAFPRLAQPEGRRRSMLAPDRDCDRSLTVRLRGAEIGEGRRPKALRDARHIRCANILLGNGWRRKAQPGGRRWPCANTIVTRRVTRPRREPSCWRTPRWCAGLATGAVISCGAWLLRLDNEQRATHLCAR